MKKLSKIIQGTELALFSFMVPYGENIQMDTLMGKREYSWTVGHLTDIGYAGFLTTIAMLSLNSVSDSKKLKFGLSIPTAMSVLECLTAIHPKINFDWQDIACYYSASLFAIGLNKLCSYI